MADTHFFPCRITRAAGAAIAMMLVWVDAQPATATESAGCAAANRGALDAEVQPGRDASARVELASGERIIFTVEGRGAASISADGGFGLRSVVSNASNVQTAFLPPAAGSYVFTYRTTNDAARVTAKCASDAVAAHRAFLARRSDLLSAQEPDRLKIDRPTSTQPAVDGTTAAPVDLDSIGKPAEKVASISVSEMAAAMAPGASPPPIVDLWFEGRYRPYESSDEYAGSSEGALSVMSVGSKYMIGPDIMVGGLAQIDRAGELQGRTGATVSSAGWMAGPYASVRFGPGVILDTRAAWGAFDDTTPTVAGGKAGETITVGRRLVRGSLRGGREVGGWTVAPSVALTYVEHSAASEEAPGVAASVGQGRLEVLPEVKRRFQIDDETFVEPRAAVGAFVGFDELAKVNPLMPGVGASDVNVKAEAGLAWGVKDGASVQAGAGVEGPATTGGADIWSGRLQLNMPLGK